jgi:hypothetical protein
LHIVEIQGTQQVYHHAQRSRYIRQMKRGLSVSVSDWRDNRIILIYSPDDPLASLFLEEIVCNQPILWNDWDHLSISFVIAWNTWFDWW